MTKKLDQRDENYIDNLANTLEGVGFTGSEELDSAVEEVAYKPENLFSKLNKKIRRLLKLPIKYEEDSK